MPQKTDKNLGEKGQLKQANDHAPSDSDERVDTIESNEPAKKNDAGEDIPLNQKKKDK